MKFSIIFKQTNLKIIILVIIYIFSSNIINLAHAKPPKFHIFSKDSFYTGKAKIKKSIKTYNVELNNNIKITTNKRKNNMNNVMRRFMSTYGEKPINIIDEKLAQQLVVEQFPQWANLPIQRVAVGGWDNRTFHLGSDKVLRFPSAADYAVQIEKEQFWLPKLAPCLPLSIPTPLGLGKPDHGYPWHWSIYNWIDGETAARVPALDKVEVAQSLAHFLSSLYRIDAEGGPQPGYHNFHRGGSLSVYDTETRRALSLLEGKIDVKAYRNIWNEATETEWKKPPVWVHGDISPGNLIIRNSRLSAVIDFGLLSVGDPACDVSIAWTFFDTESRKRFRNLLSVDDETWHRGRAWALWKALIITAGMTGSNIVETEQSHRVVIEIMEDYKKNSK